MLQEVSPLLELYYIPRSRELDDSTLVSESFRKQS